MVFDNDNAYPEAINRKSLTSILEIMEKELASEGTQTKVSLYGGHQGWQITTSTTVTKNELKNGNYRFFRVTEQQKWLK